MQKVLLINKPDLPRKVSCNPFSGKRSLSYYVKYRKEVESVLSKRFTAITNEGFYLKEFKVLNHKLFFSNDLSNPIHSDHGVYRFEEIGSPIQCKVYMGPVIEIGKKKIGCNRSKSKEKKKSLGCKGGDESQVLNFYNDDLNDKNTSALNKRLNIHQNYSRENDDYNYTKHIEYDNLIDEYKDQISDQLKADLQNIQKENFGFESLIDLPESYISEEKALIFTTGSNRKIKGIYTRESDNLSVFLSRFDLYYFEKGGFIKWIKAKIFGKTKKDLEGSEYLDKDNQKKLIEIYEKDFNSQEMKEDKTVGSLSDTLTELPVTFAIGKRKLFRKKYTYVTVKALAVGV